jgi:hypothetical protein
MSRTFKKKPTTYFRRPRGYKRAVINNARKKPPTSWDDKRRCDLAHRPWRIAENMIAGGFVYEVCIEKLMKKSAWTYSQCKKIIDLIYDDRLELMGYNKDRVEGCIIIEDEE